jgi:glucokinase
VKTIMADTTLAIDLGGTQIRAAVADGGTLRGRVARPTPAQEGPGAVVEAIVEAARDSLALAGLAGMPPVVGIAAPGPLHGAEGVVFSPPNLKGWRNVPLSRELEARFGCPVFLIKDANAAAVAEHGMGAGRGVDTLVYITVSTGIGGGLILGGRVFEGHDGTAGEVGHVTIDLNGPICNCGNRGCLEAVASGTAIARLAAERVAAGELRLLPGATISAASVYAAAATGDLAARAITDGVGGALGLACVGLVHLFNPERIILGGGLTHAGPLLLEPVWAMIERHAMPIPRARVRLLTAALGEDVGLWGAALHARDRVHAG